jgi:hypothetical protein
MSSYFLRRCLGCNLIMCLVFVVVLAYLGAEFIYNQWEQKGMNADFHCSGQCNMGLKANALHSAVRILNFSFMLMSIFSSTFQFTACPSNNMR